MNIQSRNPRIADGRNRFTDGFTVTELVVVLVCLVIVISLTLSALGMTREQSRQLLCAANLHLFGIAIHAFADDHDDTVMAMGFSPDHWWVQQNTGTCGIMPVPLDDQWSLEAIDPYLEIYEIGPPRPDAAGHLYANPPLLCPSVDLEWSRSLINAYYQSTWNAAGWPPGGFVMVNYFYWGRVDKWGVPGSGWFSCTVRNSASDDLVADELVGDRIIMSDALVFVLDMFRYNHGNFGWATNSAGGPGYHDYGPAPAITGINRLLGDGRVQWKPAADFDLQHMFHPSPDLYLAGYADYGNGDQAWFY